MDSVDMIHDHVFGSGAPAPSLLADGKLPDRWKANYLSLLASAASEWKDQPLWPSRLVSAVHFASSYLLLRYNVWSSASGQRNEETERELSALKSPSEIFLMHGSLQSGAAANNT